MRSAHSGNLHDAHTHTHTTTDTRPKRLSVGLRMQHTQGASAAAAVPASTTAVWRKRERTWGNTMPGQAPDKTIPTPRSPLPSSTDTSGRSTISPSLRTVSNVLLARGSSTFLMKRKETVAPAHAPMNIFSITHLHTWHHARVHAWRCVNIEAHPCPANDHVTEHTKHRTHPHPQGYSNPGVHGMLEARVALHAAV